MRTNGTSEYRTATHPVTKVHSENRVGDTTHAVVEVSDEGDAQKRKMHLADSCKSRSRSHSSNGNQALVDKLIEHTVVEIPIVIQTCLNIIKRNENYGPGFFNEPFDISHSGSGSEYSETRDTLSFRPGENEDEVIFQRHIQVQGEDDIIQRAQLKLDPTRSGIEIESLGAAIKDWEFAIKTDQLSEDQAVPSFFYFDLEPIKE